jgi:hypothetical protein
MFARVALSNAIAVELSLITTQTSASITLFLQASMMAWRLEPRPEANTAILVMVLSSRMAKYNFAETKPMIHQNVGHS